MKMQFLRTFKTKVGAGIGALLLLCVMSSAFHGWFSIATVSGAICLSLWLVRTLRLQVWHPLEVLTDHMQQLNSRCIPSLQKAIIEMERGNFTTEITTGTQPMEHACPGEFADAAKTFNSMLSTVQATIQSFRTSQRLLSRLIQDAKVASTTLANSSEQLSAASVDMTSITAEVGRAMNVVSEATMLAARDASEVESGSSEQAAAVAQTSDRVSQLVHSVNRVTLDAEATSREVARVNSAAEQGAKVIEDSLNGMHLAEQTVSRSAQVVQQLGQASEQIGSIVQTISEIADQTNLLALNAAIEAARAGEAGRGFSVVAEEVRKLAERSAASSHEITQLVLGIQSQTEKAVSAMTEGRQLVELQAERAQEVGQTFSEMQAGFEAISKRIAAIASAANEMSVASVGATVSMSEVSSVADRHRAAAAELATSAENVAQSVDTVNSAASRSSESLTTIVGASDGLKVLAGELADAIAKFKLVESVAEELTAHAA